MSIKVEPQLITPELATKWLEANVSNRQIKKSAIAKYVQDIERGHWESNAETIKFDTKGRLLDGQHRLFAIKKAGTPVEMLVATGLDPKTFHTIDRGVSRSIADVLSIKGEEKSSLMAAALRSVYFYEFYEGDIAKGLRSGGSRAISVHVIEDILERHPHLRDCAHEIRHLARAKLMPNQVALTCHYLFSLKHKKSAMAFIDKLNTGAELKEGDPILLLRNTLWACKQSNHRYKPEYYFAILIIAWNAVREEKSISRLYWDKHIKFPTII